MCCLTALAFAAAWRDGQKRIFLSVQPHSATSVLNPGLACSKLQDFVWDGTDSCPVERDMACGLA